MRGRLGHRDLLLGLGWLALTWFVVLTPGLRTSVVRLVVVLPLVLFWTGYGVVAALFSRVPVGGTDTEGVPGPVEWHLLAVGVSVAVGILLGTGLALSPVGLTPLSSLLGVSVVILGGMAVALFRRPIDWDNVVESDRLGTSDDGLGEGDDTSDSLFGSRDAAGYIVAALVVIAAIAGGGGMLGLAVHEPGGYTEFALLPEEGASNVTAEEYEAALGSDAGLVVMVGNHHDEDRTYVVEVTVERASRGIQDQRDVGEVMLTVEPGANETRTPDLDLPWPGETRRVVYRLYRVDGDDRSFVARTHVWLNASDGQ